MQRIKKNKVLVGKISVNSRGKGFVTVNGYDDDVPINEENVGLALHGDTVEIENGKVTRVVKRGRDSYVGTVLREDGKLLFRPDDNHIHVDFMLSQKEVSLNAEKHKAVAELTKWDDARELPSAKITRILGPAGAHETEMQAIATGAGFESNFPYEVEKEAEDMPNEISTDEIARRRDMRNTLTFTIDPETAKDFDDAISLKKLENGGTEIGVHIADVSHYVREDSALDREALRRATSVYLVDRTIPMLPEKLSNDLCSLNPNEDKLTFSAVFEFDKNDNLKSRWFGKTVIHSDHRFTYESAQNGIDTRQGPHSDALLTLKRIAEKLRKKKFAHGAISFEADEVRFRLDEQGLPIAVEKKQRTDSHLLVEDFMLLANRAVAEEIGKKKKMFVYRNHDTPNIDKIAQLSSFIQNFGYSLQLADGGVIPSSELNDLLARVAGSPEENVISTAAIRSMSKAVYSTKNIGHYGLAFKHYTHFTSPIRRYPDIMVHRLLFSHITDTPIKKSREKYEEMCVHSTEQEIQAADAERSSVKYKQVEYMHSRLGKVFDGIVSGVTKWGLYVETINEKCEGMVRLASLDDDYYEMDESTYSMVGTRTGRRIRLGDTVRVKVARANIAERTIDFEIVS